MALKVKLGTKQAALIGIGAVAAITGTVLLVSSHRKKKKEQSALNQNN